MMMNKFVLLLIVFCIGPLQAVEHAHDHEPKKIESLSEHLLVSIRLNEETGVMEVRATNIGNDPFALHLDTLADVASYVSAVPAVDTEKVELRDEDYISDPEAGLGLLNQKSVNDKDKHIGIGQSVLLQKGQFVGEQVEIWKLGIWEQLTKAVKKDRPYYVHAQLVVRVPDKMGHALVPEKRAPLPSETEMLLLDSALLKKMMALAKRAKAKERMRIHGEK